MGTTFLGLTVPDLSLRDFGGTEVAATAVNSGAEGPRSLERLDGTGRVLSRDEFKASKEGSSDGRNERTHFNRDWWSGTGRVSANGSGDMTKENAFSHAHIG